MPYLVPVAILGAFYFIDDSPTRLTRLFIIAAFSLVFALRKSSHRVLACIGIVFIGFLLLGREVGLSIRTVAAPTPYLEVQAPEHQVMLGGQRTFFLESSLLGTVSFYPGDGTMVAMAHAADPLAVGQITSVNITDHRNTIFCNVKVLVNDDQGVTLGLPEGTVVKSEMIPLGGTADIAVGETATVHSGNRGTFSVKVDGYVRQRGRQLLVLSPLSSGDTIEQGMSGSPVVQNGKLIGLLHSRSTAPFIAGKFGMARLAADVYHATVGVVEWNEAAASELSQIAPLALYPTEEQIREAHLRLTEKQEIDLDKYEPISSWSEQPIPYTPSLTGEALLHAAIQDAQREYRWTTQFPPLVLLSKDKKVLLVGYPQEANKTTVVRYDLTQNAWSKSVVVK